MARETVAQRNARYEAEIAKRLEAEVEAYPTLLMGTLERATKLGFELTVEDAKFVVRDLNGGSSWSMNPLHTNDSQAVLEALVYDVESEEENRAEQERRYAARQTALSKLTKEEKELLGL